MSVGRLKDDCLSLDNPGAQLFLILLEQGGVYPAFLTCSRTNLSSQLTNFCGIRIEGQEDRFTTAVYDKKKDFPFTVINYPQARSNIPRSILYSVFTGQLHRFYRISNTCEAFLQDAAAIHQTLVTRNGLSRGVLSAKFRAFVGAHVSKYRAKRNTLLNRLQALLTEKEFVGNSAGSRVLQRTIAQGLWLAKEDNALMCA